MTTPKAIKPVAALKTYLSGIPPRIRIWFTLLLVFVWVETLERLALLAWIMRHEPLEWSAILPALLHGMLLDLGFGTIVALPTLGILYLLEKPLKSRTGLTAAMTFLFVACGALVTVEIMEIFFWGEFQSRFNTIAVYYLIFPHEVVGNLRQSFNLAPVFPAIPLLALGMFFFLSKGLKRTLMSDSKPGERRRAAAFGAVALVFASAAVFGLKGMDGPDRRLNEAADSGLVNFVRAALSHDLEYDGVYPGMKADKAKRLLAESVRQDNTVKLDGRGPNPLWRRVTNPPLARKLNVVLIIGESMGSEYVDGLDNDSGASIAPNIAALGRQGLFFTNVYATGNRTVRGLEALLTSFPPIPGISTARRDGSEHMNSLPHLLNGMGYRTAFLYGGRALFDNMGTYWRGIGYQHVWDEGNIRKDGFSTVWGVADEYLFTEALRRMDENTKDGKPIFLSLLTVSNHRPYTYPKGRIKQNPDRQYRQYAAAYADWAIGDFIRRAKTHAWFDDTVFIVIGDHGPRVYGAAVVPVPSYRVPLVFYSPKHIKPRTRAVLGSSIDVAPTLLGLLGESYDSPFFGVDLRRRPDGAGRAVMAHNFDIAYGDGRNVAVLRPSSPPQGYRMTLGPKDLEPTKTVDQNVLDMAIATTQTAHRLFYSRAYHWVVETSMKPGEASR